MDCQGYISLFERLKRRQVNQQQRIKDELFYSEMDRLKKHKRTSEDRAKELNRKEDHRCLEIQRCLERDRAEYGRAAKREQKTLGNRLLQMDDRRHVLAKTRARAKKILEPIPETDNTRKLQRREHTRLRSTGHLAFSFQDDTAPLGRWVRYPVNSVYHQSMARSLDSFNPYRLLPNIQEGSTDEKRDFVVSKEDLISGNPTPEPVKTNSAETVQTSSA